MIVAHGPEPVERTRLTQSRYNISAFNRPANRGSNVTKFRLQAIKPIQLIDTEQFIFRALNKSKKIVSMMVHRVTFICLDLLDRPSLSINPSPHFPLTHIPLL